MEPYVLDVNRLVNDIKGATILYVIICQLCNAKYLTFIQYYMFSLSVFHVVARSKPKYFVFFSIGVVFLSWAKSNIVQFVFLLSGSREY